MPIRKGKYLNSMLNKEMKSILTFMKGGIIWQAYFTFKDLKQLYKISKDTAIHNNTVRKIENHDKIKMCLLCYNFFRFVHQKARHTYTDFLYYNVFWSNNIKGQLQFSLSSYINY